MYWFIAIVTNFMNKLSDCVLYVIVNFCFMTGKRQKRATMPISEIMSSVCCDKMCTCVVDQYEAEQLRDIVESHNPHQKQQWLLDYLWTHTRCVSNRNRCWGFTAQTR